MLSLHRLNGFSPTLLEVGKTSVTVGQAQHERARAVLDDPRGAVNLIAAAPIVGKRVGEGVGHRDAERRDIRLEGDGFAGPRVVERHRLAIREGGRQESVRVLPVRGDADIPRAHRDGVGLARPAQAGGLRDDQVNRTGGDVGRQITLDTRRQRVGDDGPAAADGVIINQFDRARGKPGAGESHVGRATEDQVGGIHHRHRGAAKRPHAEH